MICFHVTAKLEIQFFFSNLLIVLKNEIPYNDLLLLAELKVAFFFSLISYCSNFLPPNCRSKKNIYIISDFLLHQFPATELLTEISSLISYWSVSLSLNFRPRKKNHLYLWFLIDQSVTNRYQIFPFDLKVQSFDCYERTQFVITVSTIWFMIKNRLPSGPRKNWDWFFTNRSIRNQKQFFFDLKLSDKKTDQ